MYKNPWVEAVKETLNLDNLFNLSYNFEIEG